MKLLVRIITTPVHGLLRALMPGRMRSGSSQIVPLASVAGRALTAVVAIMSFLGCLTAGAVYLVNQSADAWFHDIASEITVQIAPSANEDMEQRLTKVALFLAKQNGIVRVRPLTLEESSGLLEPWLGQLSVLAELPVPRLIAVEINRQSPPDFKLIQSGLNQKFTGVTVDDHRHWQAQIRTVTRSLALGGIAVLALVAIATIAVIISATRSAMSSNREIVEVLHFVGAKQGFIAREFERHFLALGIRAGLMGAAAAALVFFLMPFVMRLLGGGTVTAAELRRLIGTASLDLTGYGILAAVVVAIAAICMFTSRYWVDRILNDQETYPDQPSSRGGSIGVLSFFKRADSKTTSKMAHGSKKKPKEREMFRMAKSVGFLAKLIGVLAVLFVVGFVLFANSIEKGQSLPRSQADGIVVLTGGTARISEAVKLLAAGKAQRLLISGVNANTSREELAQRSPASAPLFECCIDIGRDAQDTIGNAAETKQWVRQRKLKSLIVVTSSYHMPRSLAELRHTMPDIKMIPYSVVPESFRIEAWWAYPGTMRLLFSEYVKYLPTLARLTTRRVIRAFGARGSAHANANR